jgi:hypothetical protein
LDAPVYPEQPRLGHLDDRAGAGIGGLLVSKAKA